MDPPKNVPTTAGIINELYTKECPLYQDLEQVYKVMDMENCFAIMNKFTPTICRQVTCAILDELRSFFSQIKLASNLDGQGVCRLYVVSNLDWIITHMRYAQPILRPTFQHNGRSARRHFNTYHNNSSSSSNNRADGAGKDAAG